MTFFGSSKNILTEKISLNVSADLLTQLASPGPKLTAEFERSVRPDEVVITAEQLDMIFEMFVSFPEGGRCLLGLLRPFMVERPSRRWN